MVKNVAAGAKTREGVHLRALPVCKGETKSPCSCAVVYGSRYSVGLAGDISLLPPQGTLYWAGVHIWADGAHEIAVPAVRDAVGGGDDFDSALADAREKLAVRVLDSVKEGYSVKVIGEKETASRLKDDMNVVIQPCKVLGMEIPVLKSTELRQIDLDYGLMGK